MPTVHNSEIDYYQWFVLAGLLDHPELSVQCSAFWFADKPLRMELFNLLTGYDCGPVDLIDLNGKCQSVKPAHIFDLASSPRPYRNKLIRYINDLDSNVEMLRKSKIIEVGNA